jgi:hypothetical protein
MKIASKNAFVKFLRAHGFQNEGGKKHERWTNGTCLLPLPKGKERFSRVMAERLIKQAGLWEIYQKS